MPAMKGANPIQGVLKKLGSSFNKHKADETEFGFSGNLPGGINGGIADFVGGKIDLYKTGPNQGKPYMSLTGVVRLPADYRGMQTRIRVDLFEITGGSKPKTEEEQVGTALNEMRKLGINTKDLNVDDWQDVLDAKAKEGIVFRFHTYEGKVTPQYPKPRVWENWDGSIDNYKENGASATTTAVDDNTASSNGTSEGATAAEGDWAAIGEAAEGGDTDAQQQIKDAAEAAGIGDEVDNAANWIEAAALVGGGASETTVEAEQAANPEKGETVNYKPPKARKSVECEITAVFEGKQTCNLKAADGSTYKGVSWEELER